MDFNIPHSLTYEYTIPRKLDPTAKDWKERQKLWAEECGTPFEHTLIEWLVSKYVPFYETLEGTSHETICAKVCTYRNRKFVDDTGMDFMFIEMQATIQKEHHNPPITSIQWQIIDGVPVYVKREDIRTEAPNDFITRKQLATIPDDTSRIFVWGETTETEVASIIQGLYENDRILPVVADAEKDQSIKNEVLWIPYGSSYEEPSVVKSSPSTFVEFDGDTIILLSKYASKPETYYCGKYEIQVRVI